ncbi:MAG: Rpn family recombination-promoting nuclease/putative transposase [Candidatus Symbiothrix sp.]|jgi:predicted transposase/invertase (TIGR01784 family)|nr:Rpn family recombination-promoting nuclease/putative transposase [Candidatus Symbiothrix sp.]
MNEIIESTYINPLTDFGFKLLFSEEKNKAFLIDFLNEVIEEEGCITDIEYQPTFQLGNVAQNRKAVFDIFCKNEKGEYFIVEMQKAKQPYFVDRSLFYSTFPLQKQAPQGVWNFQLKAVYTVALLDFVLFEEAEDENYCIEHIYLMRDRTKTRYSKKLNFIFVELPKFKKPVEALETNVDRWLFCLKNLSRLNSRPTEVQGKIFEKLFKAAEIKKLTATDMETYNKSILEYQDVRDAVDYAREEASEKAFKKGIEKGINQKSFEIARKCFEKGMLVEEVAELIDLDAEQLKELFK